VSIINSKRFTVMPFNSKFDRPGKLSLLVIGPTPPPYHGVSVAMKAILESSLATTFDLSHVDLADRRGIEHVDKPDLHDLWLVVKQCGQLARSYLRKPPDLVYMAISQSTLGFLRDSVFLLPAMMTGRKIVVHLHGGNFRVWYEARGMVMRWAIGKVLSRVSRVIVLGEAFRSLFSGLVAQGRIVVVPNGVKYPPVVPSVKPGQERFRIMYLGTLTSLKGLFVLMNAIPPVKEKHPEVEFVFAGPWFDVYDRQAAAAFIEAHHLGDHVIFTGPVTTAEQKHTILASAHVFVFPGVQQEGQPLTVLEAMSEGLPVIATDRGCLRETIIEGETGFLIPPGSSQAIADCIVCLIEDKEIRTRLAAQAIARYREHYTMDRFIERMEKVLVDVVGEGRSSTVSLSNSQSDPSPKELTSLR
jgi:glycosyltransferase involved in cell wall biosynthesis